MSTIARPWAPHVLIVDDNRHFADSLSRLLEVWNFQPLVAYDGPSAVETALTQAPDAILLDIDLPGLDGYAVALRLRCQPGLERTLLVALTGFAREADRQRSLEAGFDRFLVKPVALEELRRLLAALVCPAEQGAE
ncbi:MAG TPA: response regulator [Gemmataceae bacterium]|jgi:CheY-like chemotaxis protein